MPSTPTALRAGSRPAPTVHLQLLTFSREQTARRCPREEHNRYHLGIVPVAATAEPLRFGTLGHHGLEGRWLALQAGDIAGLIDALRAVTQYATDESDPYELVRLGELLKGYCIRWERDADEYEILGVELEFRGPLINPETGAASRTWQRGGKLDVLVRERKTGRKLIIEHKFSGENISPASPFWWRLKGGGQSSGYIRGAELLGHDAEGVIYDVVGKIALRPLKATPAEQREYTKPKYKQCPACKKKNAPAGPHAYEIEGDQPQLCEPDPEGGPRRICTDPGGKLYANLREADETLEEYRQRVREEIAAHPEAHYQRAIIVRLEHQMREHDLEAWQLAGQLREQHRLGVAPHNWDACQRYNSVCGYAPACCGEADINGHLYRRLDWVHPELSNTTTTEEQSK